MSALPPLDKRKLGLAALVLLAPGGFVLGAALAARWWRAKNAPFSQAPPRE